MEINGKKVVFLGDSITQGAGASAPENNFVNVFSRITGAEVFNFGVSGTRIAKQTNPTVYAPQFDETFAERAMNAPADADVVVVFGGTNDFGHGDAKFGDFMSTDEHTFCGAFNELIKLLIARFEQAELIIMTPLHRASEAVTTNEIGLPCHPLIDYVNVEKKYAEYYSVPVLDLWSVSGIQPRSEVLFKRLTTDGLHPNDLGHKRIAERLAGFLKCL